MAKAAKKKDTKATKKKGPVKAKNKKEKKTVAKKKTDKKKTFEIKDLKCRTTFVTDIGQFGYMYLTEPNQKGKFDKDKLTATIMWDESEWNAKRKDSKGKKMSTIKERVEGVLLEVARKAYKDKKITLDDFQHPIKFGNDQPDPNIYADKVSIIGKRSEKVIETSGPPKIYGPKKSEGVLSEKEIKRLKAGDFGRLVLAVYPYTEGAGGISFGLDCLQMQQSGPALTGGVEASAAMLDDLEVELEDVEEPDEEEEDDDDEDEEEEASDDDDDDDEDDEDEDDDDDEDDEDEDDDEDLESFEQ
jgi:hypothetical protein